MESKEVSKIVEAELENRESFEWPAHWADNIEQFIVEPFTGNFYDPSSQELEDFWIVANLRPDSPVEGLLVIYDAGTDLFGLAEKGELFEDGYGILTGLYGDLGITLENIPEEFN